jgi:hypothetical protein
MNGGMQPGDRSGGGERVGVGVMVTLPLFDSLPCSFYFNFNLELVGEFEVL